MTKPLEDHQVYVETVGFELDGSLRWIGRCKEFPDLRTKRFRYKLNAIDEAVRLVAARVREADLREQGLL